MRSFLARHRRVLLWVTALVALAGVAILAVAGLVSVADSENCVNPDRCDTPTSDALGFVGASVTVTAAVTWFVIVIARPPDA